MAISVEQTPIDEFDYDRLNEATVATGKFAPLTKNTWFLTGQSEEAASLRFVAINPLPFRIGRRSDLSLCLPFPTVSSQHAEIILRDETLIVRDLGSTNGSFVNGNSIKSETELGEGDLVQFANVAFRVVKQSRQTFGQTAVVDVCDQALALTRFDELLNDRAVVPHFQPVIRYSDGSIFGYEILGRSRIFGLRSPKQMFLIAAQLNLETELSRMLRSEGIKKGMGMSGKPHLFVNTHPMEMDEPEKLYASLREIRETNSDQPITLEIHESAVLDPQTMQQLRNVLDELDMKLAYDDFGAGQARLVELVKVSPDYLKFDIALVKDIHKASPQHRQMLAALVQMVSAMGITPLAEGVECEESNEVCRDLGFELGQGYLFGKPAPASTYAPAK